MKNRGGLELVRWRSFHRNCFLTLGTLLLDSLDGWARVGRVCASHENEQSLTRSNQLKLEGADQKAIAKIVGKKEGGGIKRKNCDRLGKSNYAINCHANAPVRIDYTPLQSIHARFDTLLHSPEYLISLR